MLIADSRWRAAENRFRSHSARENTAVKQYRRRRSQQFSRKRIDMYILIHVIAQIMQVNRQTLRLGWRQCHIPIIERTQIRLYILRTHLQIMPLMFLLIRMNITD